MTPGPAYADTQRLRVVAEPGRRTRRQGRAITVASSILLVTAAVESDQTSNGSFMDRRGAVE